MSLKLGGATDLAKQKIRCGMLPRQSLSLAFMLGWGLNGFEMCLRGSNCLIWLALVATCLWKLGCNNSLANAYQTNFQGVVCCKARHSLSLAFRLGLCLDAFQSLCHDAHGLACFSPIAFMLGWCPDAFDMMPGLACFCFQSLGATMVCCNDTL